MKKMHTKKKAKRENERERGLSGGEQQVQHRLRTDWVGAGENAHYTCLIRGIKQQAILQLTEYKVQLYEHKATSHCPHV